jgi:hypothetical protein
MKSDDDRAAEMVEAFKPLAAMATGMTATELAEIEGRFLLSYLRESREDGSRLIAEVKRLPRRTRPPLRPPSSRPRGGMARALGALL